jgi:hypothetical protein
VVKYRHWAYRLQDVFIKQDKGKKDLVVHTNNLYNAKILSFFNSK